MPAGDKENRNTRIPLTNGAIIAMNLALLLDGRRSGLTFDEIRHSGVLGDANVSADTAKHRFARARKHLAKMGIVIASDTRGSDRTRYRLASDVTYAETTQVSLSTEEALRLTSLIVCCVQSSIPFSGDLRDAGRRIMSIAGQTNALRSITSTDIPQTNAPAQAEEAIASIASQARDERKPLAFEYTKIGNNQSEERIIDTYDICIRFGHIYIVGYDIARKAMRTFRADRIKPSPEPSIKHEQKTYEIPADFDLNDYFRLPFQYEDRTADVHSGLQGETSQADRAHTPVELVFKALHPMDMSTRARITQNQGTWSDDNGMTLWRVTCQNNNAALYWATQALADNNLELIQPSWLRAAIHQRLESMRTING